MLLFLVLLLLAVAVVDTTPALLPEMELWVDPAVEALGATAPG
jgi:hypothetical protein